MTVLRDVRDAVDTESLLKAVVGPENEEYLKAAITAWDDSIIISVIV